MITSEELMYVLIGFYDKHFRHPPQGKERRHAFISIATLAKLLHCEEVEVFQMMDEVRGECHFVMAELKDGQHAIVNAAEGNMNPILFLYYTSPAFTNFTRHSPII